MVINTYIVFILYTECAQSRKCSFMHTYIYPSIFIQHWLKTISIGPTVKTKTFKFDKLCRKLNPLHLGHTKQKVLPHIFQTFPRTSQHIRSLKILHIIKHTVNLQYLSLPERSRLCRRPRRLQQRWYVALLWEGAWTPAA